MVGFLVVVVWPGSQILPLPDLPPPQTTARRDVGLAESGIALTLSYGRSIAEFTRIMVFPKLLRAAADGFSKRVSELL
jgi:hypothetical protein